MSSIMFVLSWFYLDLMVDIWSRKFVAWDVEQSRSTDIVSKLCIKERLISLKPSPLSSS